MDTRVRSCYILRFFGIFIMMISVLPLLVCSRRDSVTIAIMTKLEAGSIVGTSEINASRLFLEDHNIKNIEIFPVNDDWKPEKTIEAYETVKNKGIRILITSHISTCALAISDRVNRDGVLTFVTGATTDEISRKDDFMLRNIQDVSIEQKSIADYVNKMPEDTILIIRDTDNYSYTNPALAYFRKNLRKSLTGTIDISIGNLDMDDLYRKISAREFKIVYLIIGGYRSAAGSVAQLVKKIRPGTKIMFTPWMKTPSLLETLGSAVADSIVPSHYPPRSESKAVDSYLRTFKSRYGYSPTFISLNVYTALEIINKAVSAGNTSPEKIKEYILKTKKFTTQFGAIEFDRYGDVTAPLFFITDLRKEF